MKKLFLLFCLVSVLFGCQTKEFDVMSDTQIPMKEVTFSAGMASDTKASVDSQTEPFHGTMEMLSQFLQQTANSTILYLQVELENVKRSLQDLFLRQQRLQLLQHIL